MRTVGEFNGEAGRRSPFALTWTPPYRAPSPPPHAAGRSPRPSGCWSDWAVAVRRPRAVARGRAALAAHPEGAGALGDRRHRRRRHHLAARADRRPAQLGLPLLLAARCHVHALCADQRRAFRGGRGLARLAAARGRGQPGRAADHVRHRRRAPADRIEVPLAAGL